MFEGIGERSGFGAMVFNRTVALKDAWAKEQAAEDAAPKPVAPPKAPEKKKEPPAPTGPSPEIEFGDFTKVAMKAGKVLAAEKVLKKNTRATLDVRGQNPIFLFSFLIRWSHGQSSGSITHPFRLFFRA